MRVISGTLKGRTLIRPSEIMTRPTAHRVRESMFSALMHRKMPPYLTGATVLDAFAGSGALGIEALSRGAEKAIFFEKHPSVAKILKANLMNLGIKGTIFRRDAFRPPQTCQAVDILFLDPPYETQNILSLLDILEIHGWIHSSSLIVYEADTLFQETGKWQIRKQYSFGNCKVYFIQNNNMS